MLRYYEGREGEKEGGGEPVRPSVGPSVFVVVVVGNSSSCGRADGARRAAAAIERRE